MGTAGRSAAATILLAVLAVVAGGCARPAAPAAHTPYRTVAEDARRDTDLARRLTARAIELIRAGQLDAAQATLREALEADLFHAPAHNNLGHVYFRRGDYYLAAWEFEYAAGLAPHSPEPRFNLGMVFEHVGQLEKAAEHYAAARAAQPDNPHILAALTRTHIRAGRQDPPTRALLQELTLKHPDPTWQTWARQQLMAAAGTDGG